MFYKNTTNDGGYENKIGQGPRWFEERESKLTVDEVSGIIGKGVMNDTWRHRENNGFQGSKKVTEMN